MKQFSVIAALLISFSCAAQQKTSGLIVVNRTLSVNGDVIRVDERENDGIAWLNGKTFTHGTINVDIKGRNLPQKSFVGIALHGVNDTTFEAIYFRPFNFHADDPERKAHQVQYVAEPKYGWEKLRNEHHNQYEKAVSPVPASDDWFHARIEVHGNTISVFVNDSKTASLTVQELVNTGGKKIGYWVGNGSDGSWKNLKITPSGN